MSKILMLTSIFPIPNVKMKNTTSVCYYFAKEWVKKGHEVLVIYNYTIYTPILHIFSNVFINKIASLSAVNINQIRYKNCFSYNHDGIKVYLVPCYKPIPKVRFSKRVLEKQVNKINDILINENFIPEYITGHFLNPNLNIVAGLKKLYKAKTAVILHGEIQRQCDINTINNNIDYIDIWGFRSVPIKNSFEKIWNERKVQSFLCFSGVPEEYICHNLDCVKEFDKGLKKYIFVGNLIKRKYPFPVLKALHKIYNHKSFSFNIVGDGDQMKPLEKYINKNNLQQSVKLIGRVDRNKVSSLMSESDYFILISKNETFGLVYLEAMAKGCITIASKNEGMEGIIKDGVNGFLCNAGDAKDLEKKIIYINSLSNEKLQDISKNAIMTAQKMTDSKMADEYLKNLLSS